jgi:hypothetical protein
MIAKKSADDPVVYLEWRAGKITAEIAMQLLGKTEEAWERYIEELSKWGDKEWVYQQCCVTINIYTWMYSVNLNGLKQNLQCVISEYSSEELIEDSVYGFGPLLMKAVVYMVKECNTNGKR